LWVDVSADVRGEVVEEAADAALGVAVAIVVVDSLDVPAEQISLKRLVVSIFRPKSVYSGRRCKRLPVSG
jgi:hypothetical protein